MGRPCAGARRRPVAARLERHPHDVHALPDRRRLRRPARPAGRFAARPVGPSRACGPGRGLVPLVRGAKGVLELPVGTIDATRDGGRRPGPDRGRPRPAALTSPGEGRAKRSIGTIRAMRVRSAHSARSILPCPARCVGCGREGPPLCAALRAGARRPAGAAGRHPDRPAGRPPGAAPPARVVRAVRRSRPARPPRAEVRRRAAACRTRSGGPSPGAGRRSAPAATSSSRCPSTPSARGSAATTRPP